MFHESEVSIQRWENVRRVSSYSEMSVHPRSFWQQHHAPRNLVVRVNTASFLLCAGCRVAWGLRKSAPRTWKCLLNFCSKLLLVLPSRFESIVAMAHSLKKNRWGSCRTRVWLQWTRSRHWHSSMQASCFGKEMPLVKGEIWKGSSGACCIQRHLDFAQTIFGRSRRCLPNWLNHFCLDLLMEKGLNKRLAKTSRPF